MTAIRLNQNVFFNSVISVRMSEAQINKHMPDRRVSSLKDERRPLYLRFNSDRKTGTWWYRHYENGGERKVRLGRYPTTKVKDVISLLSAATVNIKKDEPVFFHGFESVDQLVEWYVNREISRKLSSKARLNNLRSMADNHLLGMFHCVPLSRVDHDLVDTNLIKAMFDDAYSVAYVRAVFNLLKTSFRTAHKLKYITVNPLAEIKFKHFFNENFSLTKAQCKGCRFSADQIPGLLSKLKTSHWPVKILILMMLSLGARIGETRQAKWSDISFASKRWIIPKDKTKNRLEMIYPLTNWLILLLNEYREWQLKKGYAGDHIFPASLKTNEPASAELSSYWVRSIANKAWSSHDLRKRARSIWLDLGIDYLTCEALLNHSMTRLDHAYIYTHLEMQKKQAIELYHEWLKKHW